VLADVSIIVAARNAEATLDECLGSVCRQEGVAGAGAREVSLWDDASTDGTAAAAEAWRARLLAAGWALTVGATGGSVGLGPGAARDRAVAASSGGVLVVLDADDVMHPTRVAVQVAALRGAAPLTLVGAGFERRPADATRHYTAWANGLSTERLVLEQYREVTLIQPTWCLARSTFDAAGGYGAGLCEDLRFFHSHLDGGGHLLKAGGGPLVVYRQTAGSVCGTLSRRDLLRARLAAFERRVLGGPDAARWSSFMLWGAGRDGRNVYNDLSPAARQRVAAFVDVDPAKIGTPYLYVPDAPPPPPEEGGGGGGGGGPRKKKRKRVATAVPVLHFSEVKPPFLVCVAMGRTDGALERNVASLGYVEGQDYWHFS